MTDVTLQLSDHQLSRLKAEYEDFVAIAAIVDSAFRPPSFDQFLVAKATSSTVPLSEEAVGVFLRESQYSVVKAWFKQHQAEQRGNELASLLRSSRKFGFMLTCPDHWDDADRQKFAAAFVEHLAKESGLGEESVANMIQALANTTWKITFAAQEFGAKAMQVANGLQKRAFDLYRQLTKEERNDDDRRRLAEWEVVAELAVMAGVVDKEEQAAMKAQLEICRDDLYAPPAPTFRERCEAFFNQLFGCRTRPTAKA